MFFTRFINQITDACHHHTSREDVGLGSPPVAFCTNDSESINAVIKECIGFKRQKWAIFNDTIKVAVTKQQQEFEKAIIGLG